MANSNLSLLKLNYDVDMTEVDIYRHCKKYGNVLKFIYLTNRKETVVVMENDAAAELMKSSSKDEITVVPADKKNDWKSYSFNIVPGQKPVPNPRQEILTIHFEMKDIKLPIRAREIEHILMAFNISSSREILIAICPSNFNDVNVNALQVFIELESSMAKNLVDRASSQTLEHLNFIAAVSMPTLTKLTPLDRLRDKTDAEENRRQLSEKVYRKENEKSPVVYITRLDETKVKPLMLYNILSLYGTVRRIIIIGAHTQRYRKFNAYVQMSSPVEAQRVKDVIKEISLFYCSDPASQVYVAANKWDIVENERTMNQDETLKMHDFESDSKLQKFSRKDFKYLDHGPTKAVRVENFPAKKGTENSLKKEWEERYGPIKAMRVAEENKTCQILFHDLSSSVTFLAEQHGLLYGQDRVSVTFAPCEDVPGVDEEKWKPVPPITNDDDFLNVHEFQGRPMSSSGGGYYRGSGHGGGGGGYNRGGDNNNNRFDHYQDGRGRGRGQGRGPPHPRKPWP